MNPQSFLAKLDAAARLNQSWLCVGLDPDASLAPTSVPVDNARAWIAVFNRGIIDATRDLVCCYKPNIAFYEAFGAAGMDALRDTLAAIPDHIPVLLDAKRGDIGNTAKAYARAVFEDLGVDAVTVNPYLGSDSLEPFFAYPDRGVFVLCKTSNPGGGDLQDLLVGEEGRQEPLYRMVARRAQEWDQHGTLGLVVGATYPSDLAAVRNLAPSVPILIPGVGAQAGDLEAAVHAGQDSTGGRAIVNASRAVLYASRASDWQAAAREAATNFRDAINAASAPIGTAP